MAVSVVLDASAVLAMMIGEVGWDRVAAALPQSVISTVNAAEVYSKLADRGIGHDKQEKYRAVLTGRLVPFDEDLVLRVAKLRPLTRAHGLSLGDRACLALAQRLGVPAMTADSAWSRIETSIPIEFIR